MYIETKKVGFNFLLCFVYLLQMILHVQYIFINFLHSLHVE